ncbi:N-acetyltransferase [Kribbella sp. NBC_00382]|uniref:GNAT family N-acetyltransferase n=1 Tax=Kribbella sp. NBC_00382 TaxID=2975967 RepID=UPI002E231966
MDIREELPGDGQVVRGIHLQAFGDHGLVVADMVDALRDTTTAAGRLSLVAEQDVQVVGHVMFTSGLLDADRRLVEVYVLSPLAVMAEFHRRGIGAALVRYGLGILAEKAVPLVWLEGDPRYYMRFGFMPGDGRGFRKPSLRIPDDAFQVITLPAYEPWMTGTLVYPDAFWRYDAVGLRSPEAEARNSPAVTQAAADPRTSGR